MTEQATIFQPVAAMLLLAFVAGIRMYALRIPFFLRRENDPDAYRTRRLAGSISDRADAAGDNYVNQFELPVIFYVLSISLYVLGRVDATYMILAWAFVATRFAHHFVHVTYNRVVHRFLLYISGFIILLIMLARFVFQIFSS